MHHLYLGAPCTMFLNVATFETSGDTLFHPLQTAYKETPIFDMGRDIENYEYFPGWAENVRPGLLSDR